MSIRPFSIPASGRDRKPRPEPAHYFGNSALPDSRHQLTFADTKPGLGPPQSALTISTSHQQDVERKTSRAADVATTLQLAPSTRGS
jgi:hypothetical protein